MLTKENLIHTVTKITVLKENDECKMVQDFSINTMQMIEKIMH